MIEQCKSCKNKEIINGIIGCVYMDADCQNGEKYEAETITNADRIRAMSDEELADFITDKEKGWCTDIGREMYYQHNLEWLKQPVGD